MSKPHKSKSDGLSPRAEYIVERHGSVLVVWLLLVIMNWMQNGKKLLSGELTSNDDYMRMAEIRDWLGGQNWFDMHQYRLNPIDPLYSHWSRISDVLIGGPIKILTPVLGQAKAELFVVMAYPSMLMLVYLYLATALAQKLIKTRATPVIATFILALSFGAMSQFGLGRIDHHGLQIVMALGTVLLITTSVNRPKHLIYASILCGIALYIGIESAPYVAAACVSIVLIWAFDECKSEQKLRYFGVALATTTIACLLISAPPSRWLTPSCDAISIVYVELTIAISVVMWGLSFATAKLKSAIARFGLAALLGGAALGITIALFPNCLHGPYAGLDPRLVEIWLSNVAEAGNFKKLFMSDIATGTASVILPVLAMLGYFAYSLKSGKSLSLAHRTMVIFITFTLLAGLVQTRLMYFATALSIPLAAYLMIHLLIWAGKFKPKSMMIIMRGLIMLALAPATLPLVLSLFTKPKIETTNSETSKTACISYATLNPLNALPTGTALTQIDLGAPIIHFTNHSVTSAPYHRSADGILATLDMFIEDEATAKDTVIAMKADYVIACNESGETNMMLKYGKTGMLAKLKAGDTPDWLEKVDVDTGGALMVYRVKID